LKGWRRKENWPIFLAALEENAIRGRETIRHYSNTTVHKAIIFTETFSALDLGEENIASLTISGKTDGLVVQCIPGALDVMEFLAVIESIACIELKTNTAITSQQSFNQAVKELILLSLKSRYKVFTVLTDGQDWYFLFLVNLMGCF